MSKRREIAAEKTRRAAADPARPGEEWYHLYFRPFVLVRGKPYFAGARPPLRFVASNLVGEDADRLTFVTA